MPPKELGYLSVPGFDSVVERRPAEGPNGVNLRATGHEQLGHAELAIGRCGVEWLILVLVLGGDIRPVGEQ